MRKIFFGRRIVAVLLMSSAASFVSSSFAQGDASAPNSRSDSGSCADAGIDGKIPSSAPDSRWGQLFRVLDPQYPRTPRDAVQKGSLFSTLVVTAGGQVKAMRSIRTEPANPELEKAFARAAAAWRFHSALGEICTGPDRNVDVQVDVDVRDDKPVFAISLPIPPKRPCSPEFAESRRIKLADRDAVASRLQYSFPKQNRIDGIEAVVAVEFTLDPSGNKIDTAKTTYVDAYYSPVMLIRKNKLIPLSVVPIGPVEAPVPVRMANANLFQRAAENALEGERVTKPEGTTAQKSCIVVSFALQGESKR